MIPLMIQAHYPNSVMNNRQPPPRPGTHPQYIAGARVDPAVLKLEQLSQAADAVTDMELATTAIRAGGNWSLLPTAGALCVRAAFRARGGTKCQFPQWLGKNSTANKRRRLVSFVVSNAEKTHAC